MQLEQLIMLLKKLYNFKDTNIRAYLYETRIEIFECEYSTEDTGRTIHLYETLSKVVTLYVDEVKRKYIIMGAEPADKFIHRNNRVAHFMLCGMIGLEVKDYRRYPKLGDYDDLPCIEL